MAAVVGLATLALVLSAVGAFAPESASREERFANPPASARLLPIRHQRPDDRARADAEIAELVDRGYGGMVVNAPLGKRYMVATNGWGTFRHVVRTCREKGLSLWLYDEDGYPSGSARNLVLKDHPEWTASGILVAMRDGPGGANVKVPPPPGSHRRTFVCPLVGDCPDLSRLQSLPVVAHGTNGVEIAFPPGADTRWRAMVVSVGPVYEGSHASCNLSRRCKYPNLLMREPTAEFIRVTHGTYARELGEDLGAFTSTFTDEPSLMTYWFKPMEYVPLPWSEELAAGYAAKTGRELVDDVPDLLFASADDDSSEKRHLFWKMVADRVADNYFGQIREWCRRSGIGSGGHLLFEEGIPGHVGLYGDFFRCLRTFDNPGMDCLTSTPKSVPWRTARLVGSAGALNGAKRVMCEVSDHSQRYREPGNTKPIRYVTEDEVKGTIARLVWGGINTLTSYYVFDQLDADAQRRINLAAGRLVTLMSDGHDASDVAVLYPSDAMMATYEPSRQFGGGARNAAISEKFCKATELLYKAGRPFLIVDAASLAEAKVKGGELVRGDFRWRTVVLPTKRHLDSSVLDRLAEFERAGGWILEADQVETALATSNAFVPLPFRIVSGDAFAAKFLWAHRRTATEDIWLVVSRSASAWKGTVGCSGDTARGEIRLYDPSRGTCETVDRNRIELDLPPWGAVVLVVSGGRRPVMAFPSTGQNADFQVRYPDAVAKRSPLRGVMLPPEKVTEKHFRTLKEWGVTLGRYQMMPTGPDAWLTTTNCARYVAWLDAKLDTLADEVLPLANRYGIQLVIDIHVPPGGRDGQIMHMCDRQDYLDCFVDCWKRIAMRLKGRTCIYGYDLINEPDQKREAKVADYWEIQRRAAEAVREIDQDTTILVASNGWNKPDNFAYLSPLAMDNVIYQVHVYQPMAFTHQGVLPKYKDDVTRWPDDSKGWNKDWLRRILKPVREFQLRHHAKIYAGEFSAVSWAEGADRYLADLISLFEEYGWDWSYHAFREWSGWSVEHEGPDKDHLVPSADNPRKRVLLNAFRGREVR